ncbi:hypothetical protein BDK51DRAFT_45623 [Blyttiomyces helicus]|uniref:IGFBP N-terminal domain-containing protein n=1 Tax=Blyttiomyces helicus TaxID=388810 RepID=A0A4P9W1Q7_9FUNG|nr:hypothetical protein BDK51DRAFT_45623 [Blyttiomyces helicus]|eukprot:RKO84006.1 hypothetical protein BDK51DRAFT_45623 [Blyttiomyces helicus]
MQFISTLAVVTIATVALASPAFIGGPGPIVAFNVGPGEVCGAVEIPIPRCDPGLFCKKENPTDVTGICEFKTVGLGGKCGGKDKFSFDQPIHCDDGLFCLHADNDLTTQGKCVERFFGPGPVRIPVCIIHDR